MMGSVVFTQSIPENIKNLTNVMLVKPISYRFSLKCGKVRKLHPHIQTRCKYSKKGKRKWIYIAPLLYYLTLKALRYGSHSFDCKLHRTCIYLVSIHQMAPPQTEVADI